ncbi:MAG: sulfur carrier protein ThiS adenylyltransferase ThiF [Campylobacter sp.]
MRVLINGKFYEVKSRTIFDLKDEFCALSSSVLVRENVANIKENRAQKLSFCDQNLQKYSSIFKRNLSNLQISSLNFALGNMKFSRPKSDLNSINNEQILHYKDSQMRNFICILDGYAIDDENVEISPNSNVIFAPKYAPPGENELDLMLSSRNSPRIAIALKSARVAICGLGGLGSNVAIILARLGVGNLHLIDFDSVDCTNLNRQSYFIRDLGAQKTAALSAQIRAINPHVNIRVSDVKLDEKNVQEILKDDEIICECFDGAKFKAILVESVLRNFSDKIIIAASGLAGSGSANEIYTKRISKRFYLCGDFKSGAKIGSGLMSPRVWITAGHQANAVLRVILKEKDE